MRLFLAAFLTMCAIHTLLAQTIINRVRICKDSDGLAIEQLDIYLPQQHFSEAGLRDCFADLAAEHPNTELWVTASSDLAFLEALDHEHSWQAETGRIKAPLPASEPLAYFFRIGKNAFFQYRDDANTVKWVLMEGRNLMEGPAEAPRTVRFAGFRFGHGTFEPCKYVHLSLCFVLPDLGEMQPLEILHLSRSYARLFPQPHTHDIDFVQCFGWAGATSKFLRPALDGDLSEPVDMSRRISTTFGRGSPGPPYFLVYRGE